jgi:hypothetical protein
MLLIINLTALSAQTGDTLTCFNNAELQKIANKVVYANECDSTLGVLNQEIKLKDTVIDNLSETITFQDSVLLNNAYVIKQRDLIIDIKKTDLNNLYKKYKKKNAATKWLQAGWIATSVSLVAVLIAVAVR